MIRSNRIRSTYQRKILDWLSDGGGTVTEVSQALQIRVPHVSSALRKLRESGHVVRDDTSKRGSKYRLTSSGINRLESDALSRLKELVTWPPPPGAAGIVLARDKQMLLLGYVSKPLGPLLGLPDQPMNDDIGTLESSNGNQGESESWIWAVQRHESTVWWDLETMRKSNPPEEASPMTLSAWMERPKLMGIIRAKVIEGHESWPLSVGSWFRQLTPGHWPKLPEILTDGETVLGRAGNNGPLVKPRGGILAKLGKRLDRSIVLRSLAPGSLTIAESDLLSKPKTPLPRQVLRHWLQIIHPRLNLNSIDEKYSRLISDLDNFSSNALTRKLISDFPGREWNDNFSGFIDTSSISMRAAEAILRFAMDASDLPINLDWRWENSIELLKRFSGDSRCGLLIHESKASNLPFVLTATDDVGRFTLQMPGRLHLPVSVNSQSTVPGDWIKPQKPSEVTRGNAQKVTNAENEHDALWKACQLATGDDAWADRHEKKFPLASWIATEKKSHASRWRRVGSQIDPIWSRLADITQFDDSDLSELALYDDEIFTVLMDKIRENPLMAVSTRVENPAVATAILLSKDWIREEVEVIDCWLQNPLRVSEVLRENWSSNDIERLVCACPHHKMLFENKTLNDRVSILAIMEDVHHSLWEKESLQWLLVCLGSTMGRAALSMLDLPWPAILYKKRINSDELRLVHHMPNGPGKDSLLDVLDGLESVENNLPPKRGRTHPMAGWLFQEKIPKPPLKDNHNMEIHIALHRRFQQ